MAANATGKSGDPIIIEDASLRGDSADNPIEIKEDALDFMNDWTAEQIREYLLKQKTQKVSTNNSKWWNWF